MTTINSDLLLFRKIQSGDDKALEILFKTYYSRLCSFALGFVKQPHIAEEIVADLFTNLWLKRSELELHTSVKSYLFSAVKNLSINVYHKKNNELYFDDTLKEIPHKLIDSPLDEMMFDETVKYVDKMIDAMPQQRRQVFRLNRIEGLSYKEIAHILGISAFTVQNHMTEATRYIALKRHSLVDYLTLSFFIGIVGFGLQFMTKN